MVDLKYKRIILKISGGLFAGDNGVGVDFAAVEKIAGQVIGIKETGVELGVTLGGGNISRGRNITALNNSGIELEQMTLHNMGMLGSVLNGLALLGVLRSKGADVVLLSRVEVPKFVEPYNRDKALAHLKAGKIVIFTGGTGVAFVTHDTAVAQLSLELDCEILLKGTDVDGVYDKDPKRDNAAKKFDEITYGGALEKDLKIMDATALALCQQHNLPIIVFNMREKDAVKRILRGEKVGTLVK